MDGTRVYHNDFAIACGLTCRELSDSMDDLDPFGFLLGRTYDSYIRLLQLWLNWAGLAWHLITGEGSLLFALFREDDRTITEIADELRLAKSTMTGMVAQLREAGLITTEADAYDERVERLQLSPLAKSLMPKCRKLAEEMERLLGQHLTHAAQGEPASARGIFLGELSVFLAPCEGVPHAANDDNPSIRTLAVPNLVGTSHDHSCEFTAQAQRKSTQTP